MTLLPKPARRGPKPRTRIRRSRLKRVPVALKRGKGIRQRSNRPIARVRESCRRLCSRIAKAMAGGWCLACAPVRFHRGTDAAHVWAKSTHPGVEFDPDNLLWLCRKAHDRVGSAKSEGPCEMRDLAESILGPERVEAMRVRGLSKGPDVRDVLPALRKTADELGIK